MFRFYHIVRKTADSPFENITRHYARAKGPSSRAEGELNTTEEREEQRRKVPIIKSKKKLYDFYKGDPVIKNNITLACHGWMNRNTRGDHFFIYPYVDNDIDESETDCRTFEDLGVDNSVCNQLENTDISEPLKIQKLGIPKIMEGSNVLLAAETGCGKTIAYLLPLLTKVLAWKQNVQRKVNSPLGLIITPSRELAVQIALELIKLSKPLGIQTKIITGGKTKKMILDPPMNNVDVVVCSFGVISKLTTFGIYDLKCVRYVVLDEADALFHDTFETKLRIFMKRIFVHKVECRDDTTMEKLPDTAQIVLTSATIPSRLKIVLCGILNPDSIEYVTTEKLHKIWVPQKFMRLIPSQKPQELLKYVKPKALSKQRVIIFSNRNSTSHWVSSFLHNCGIKVTNLHGDMHLVERRGKYGKFLNGETIVLSTTNGGSRGLDTLMVNHILNYDFPFDTASYIHRCGRTGRLGTKGASSVTNFISKLAEVIVVKKIEMAARKLKPLPIFDLLEQSKEEEEEEKEEEEEANYTEEIVENLDDGNSIPY